jgi:ABC-type amino acid transport substrate-binding protein
VALNAFYYSAYPSAIVNVIWFAIALATLANVLKPRNATDSTQPGYSEGRTVNRVLLFTGAVLAILGGGLAVLVISPRPPQPLQHVNVFTGSWEPFIGENLDRQGPVAELGRRIFRRAGYEPEIQFVGWTQAEDRIVENQEFAAFPFVASGERQEDVLFSDAIHSFDYVVFYRDGGPVTNARLEQWNAGEIPDMEWRVGIPAGYGVWPALEAAIRDGNLETTEFTSVREAFRALDAGQVELVPESRLVGESLLLDPTFDVDASRIRAASLSPEELERGVPAGAKESLHIMVPPTEAGSKLVEELNRAIATEGAQAPAAAGRGILGGEASAGGSMATGEEPATRVELQGVVEALDEDGASYRLANGVQAVVLRWPRAFVAPGGGAGEPSASSHDDTPFTELCRVKIMSGPLRGRILHVEPESFLVLPPEED